MCLTDLIRDSSICVPLLARDEPAAIRELVQALAAAGDIEQQSVESVVDAVLSREQMGTTALGHDAALPHAKHVAARRCTAALGVSPRGINFHSVDKEAVHVIFLVVSPPDCSQDHLQALKQLSGVLQDAFFRSAVKEATGMRAVREVLREAEERQAAPAT
jgi:PTS system fructose-specific IIA component/PTS system nitrogen regulatory IIA component